MKNFNGQLKKRTVNLGGGFKKNRNALLLNSHKEREKREKDRKIEHDVVFVQNKIRRYLNLLNWKLIQSADWSSNIKNSNDINSQVFSFNIFYSFVFKHNENRLDQIITLNSLISKESILQLRDVNRQGLYHTTYTLLSLINVTDSVDIQVLKEILKLLQFLPQPITKSNVSVLPGLIQLFNKLHSSQKETSIQEEILKNINTYAYTSIPSYLLFLSNSYISSLPNFQIDFASVSSGLSNETFDSFLNTDEKIQLLYNSILNSNNFTPDYVVFISHISASIGLSLTSKEEIENRDDDNEDDDEKDDEITRKIIPDSQLKVIKKLCDREFITFAKSNVKDPNTLSILCSSLINLLPSIKSTFIIFLIPNIFEYSLNSIISSKLFKTFLEVNEDSLFLASPSFLSAVFVESSNFIYYDLYTFLELFRYRLIISNDFELFTTYGFSIDKFKDLAIFLKRFVFNMIWNHQKIKPLLTRKKYKHIKNLLTSVLTQIYLKNARQGVLPDDIWIVNINKISNIIDTIVEYEEKKEKYDDDSEDEDNSINYISTLRPDSQAKVQIYLQAPFFIPFEKRVEIFQRLVQNEKYKIENITHNFLYAQDATIRREHLLEDSFNSFNSLGSGFKSNLKIVFENENGRERGIDGGGLTKELLTSLVKEGFHGLFVENSNHELYPNPQIGLSYQYRIDTQEQLKNLEYIKFLGKVIGKCLHERILVDITFASFFLTKFNSGYRNSFDDLKSLDNELYSSLVKLLSYSEEELKALAIPFTIDERIGKKNISIDLIPNGSTTFVNSTNKFKFIHELSNYKLNKMINLQCNFFLSGLFEIISKDWLSMFNPYELQMLISGEDDVDIEDLKRNTYYTGYSDNDKTIRDLWEVVEAMDTSDKFKFVKFVTSVPRAPLLGFGVLFPKFAINREPRSERLPTSSTCMNLMRLPDYENKEILKEKLLYAINAGAGFDLE